MDPTNDTVVPQMKAYGPDEVAGVMTLVIAGGISCAAVVPILLNMAWRRRTLHLRNTRIVPFFVSLLVANALQCIGTLMNGRWAIQGKVVDGPFCRAQGGIKQAGNVAMALWSFTLSLHVFMLLFSRITLSKTFSSVLLFLGWYLIAFVVAIGPLAIEQHNRGPYFGPTGYWCWITAKYPLEQLYLEYFLEFLSAGLSFFLYTAVLLRVRGNLTRTSGRWSLRFVPHGERWVLAIRRDAVDGHMMQVAARMVWYPVAYAILVLPVTIARFVMFSGHDVPFRATIFADFVFNLQGVANVLLFLATRRFLPDADVLPIFTPRKHISLSSPEAYGITPFVLPPPTAATTRSVSRASSRARSASTIFDAGGEEKTEFDDGQSRPRLVRSASVSTISSVDSQTPLFRDRSP
ncbi:hypothetical protein C8Q77DRAFT_1107253 [Trametes polyzona]|nr:hypothetical protein C8Q77DRAFT_1107253 [Trametes polyzona]